MKRIGLSLIVIMFSIFTYAQTDVVGTWKTIDDETGKEKSTVKIYKATNGKYYGKIIDITNPDKKNGVCEKCEGSKKNKPLMGMNIIEGLEKDGTDYSGGTITNPEDGEVYTCTIWREGENLKVRGYIGWFYKTQTWIKVN
ncbi:DUF2147 domain-containing protein [Crocinitomix catalasitica]|uniref:DUF2147 domain-containing protein n=1 Tax=Crocinitomix catalasitica TaxID=184607 RepID=UPI0004804031|nr:DUF2147 domain-containing protein [Crocinitomix catalasitica]